MSCRAAPKARAVRQRGLSIIEMLIGVAMGLFITAGAATLFASNLTNSRRMLIEARMDQDLRAAADLIARDLRRAGYWEGAMQGAVPNAAGATVANPYRSVTPATNAIGYAYAKPGTTCATTPPCGDQSFALQVAENALRLQWNATTVQPVTDSNVMTVSLPDGVVDDSPTSISLGASCSTPCTTATYANCPTTSVRHYTFRLVGTSPATSKDVIRRELTTSVRVRNDRIEGNCP